MRRAPLSHRSDYVARYVFIPSVSHLRPVPSPRVQPLTFNGLARHRESAAGGPAATVALWHRAGYGDMPEQPEFARCRARSTCTGRNARFAAVRVPPAPGRQPRPGRPQNRRDGTTRRSGPARCDIATFLPASGVTAGTAEYSRGPRAPAAGEHPVTSGTHARRASAGPDGLTSFNSSVSCAPARVSWCGARTGRSTRARAVRKAISRRNPNSSDLRVDM